jgi:hypothetical protein
MYFTIVKQVLDESLPAYAEEHGIAKKEVYAKIQEHLAEMSKQHREDDPTIPYDDPLCRLAYVFKHVGANATLFERAVKESEHVRNVLKARVGATLKVCAVGGGPGSELLGLTKFLSRTAAPDKYMPKRIDFVLLDRVPQWGESWDQLAGLCENELETIATEARIAAPAVAPQFHGMDVTDPTSYKSYAWLFSNVDLVVFNYLISENLEHLDDLAKCLSLLAKKTRDGAFLFIDRKEYSDRINDWLLKTLPTVGLAKVGELQTHGGCMSTDELIDPDLGKYPERFKSGPRVKFETRPYGTPTAFSVTAKKAT